MRVQRTPLDGTNTIVALLALPLQPSVLTDGGALALLALSLLPSVLTEGGATALLALSLPPSVFTEGGATASLSRPLQGGSKPAGRCFISDVMRVSFVVFSQSLMLRVEP